MRSVTIFATLVSLAGAAFAGQALWQALVRPPAAPVLAEVVPPAGPGAVLKPGQAAPRSWPALLGELKPPEPEPQPPAPPEPEPQPPEPEPQPPAPPPAPMPPLGSLGYQLKGVVKNGATIWAIVSHPTGELILRRGDTFDDGLVVTQIDEEGLWARRQVDGQADGQGADGQADGPRVRLGFAE